MNSSGLGDLIRYTLIVTWGVVTLVLLIGVIVLGYRVLGASEGPIVVPDGNVVARNVPTAKPAAGKATNVFLYFADGMGEFLAPQMERIPLSSSPPENCRRVVQALIRGPKEGLTPIVPESASLRGIYQLDNGELVIDFSREMEVSLKKSAAAEMLMVQGVVASVMQRDLYGGNDQPVTAVRFLFEGAPPGESFPAHVDLSEPVTVDRSWIGQRAESATDG